MNFLGLLLLLPGLALAQSWPRASDHLRHGLSRPAPASTSSPACCRSRWRNRSAAASSWTTAPARAATSPPKRVARAKPDGYTLLLGTAATHGVNAALYKKLPFDVEADFTPIAPLVNVSNVLTVNPQVIDVKTVREFIEHVKANPGKYNYASTGNGTGTHLAFAELVSRAGPEDGARALQGRPGGPRSR